MQPITGLYKEWYQKSLNASGLDSTDFSAMVDIPLFYTWTPEIALTRVDLPWAIHAQQYQVSIGVAKN